MKTVEKRSKYYRYVIFSKILSKITTNLYSKSKSNTIISQKKDFRCASYTRVIYFKHISVIYIDHNYVKLWDSFLLSKKFKSNLILLYLSYVNQDLIFNLYNKSLM